MQPSTRLKPRHFPDCSFRFWFLNVEVALLSELEFRPRGVAGHSVAPKTATPAPSRRPSVLLHDLLTTNADGVAIGARATARVDMDPQFYLHKASGEAKPHLITDFVSDTVTDTEETSSLGPGATLTLTSRGTKPKLHAVSPAMWIAANARIMAALYDSDDMDHGAAKDYMAYTAKIGAGIGIETIYTWASVLAYDQEYRRRHWQQPGSADGDRTHSTCAQCC